MQDELLIELHYLGSTAYYGALLNAQQICIEGHEHYSKGSYRNRMHIATPQGKMRLSIPLIKGKNSQMPVRDVQIAYDENWQLQHWKGILAAYGKSPFFEFYGDELQVFYERKEKYLFDWNWSLFEWINETMNLELVCRMSEEYIKSGVHENDKRDQFTPKLKTQSSSSNVKPYGQVFEDKTGFLPNLSILDMLFCTGPEAVLYIQ